MINEIRKRLAEVEKLGVNPEEIVLTEHEFRKLMEEVYDTHSPPRSYGGQLTLFGLPVKVGGYQFKADGKTLDI